MTTVRPGSWARRTWARLKWRVLEAVAARVRAMAFGTEVNFPGDPRRQLIADHTAWVPMGLVEFFPGDGGPVTVGRHSGLHHTVRIIQGGIHHVDWVSSVHLRIDDAGNLGVDPRNVDSYGPVDIGGDVWVGYEALIMSGVTIGHGAVVAARAIVTRDVEPYSIVGGNPAKHITYRFDEPTREALLRIAWWDWPDEKIAAHQDEIDSPDVAGFIARHDPHP